MENIKQRMYEVEATPPAFVWQNIVAELDNVNLNNQVFIEKLPVVGNRNNKSYYMAAAAAIAIIIFSFIFFSNNFSSSANELAANAEMRVPDNSIDTPKKSTEELATNVSATHVLQTEEIKEVEKKEATTHITLKTTTPKNYITISGPQGKPVKVSAKVAALIVSSDDSYPPKPIWNKKIDKWKSIMNSNALAATPDNFMDIVELNKTLNENTN